MGKGFAGTTYLYVHESEESRRTVVKTGEIEGEMNMIKRHLNKLDRACPIVRGIALAKTSTSTLDDMIVMEAWSGDLESLLKEYIVTPPTLAFVVVRAIGSALECFERHDLFYLDLKPDNILYRRGPRTNTIELALGDVGGLCDLGHGFVPVGEYIRCSVELGLDEPVDPEVGHRKNDEKSSLWALGLLLARLVQPDVFKAYETSFSKADGDHVILDEALLELNESFMYRSKLELLVVRMLDVDPSKRPTLKELRKFGDDGF
jgi:serine/threonine protein kinase